jgi:gliding motility-associated-like protein
LKRFLFQILFFILLVPLAQATHLIGGSMSYQYLGQNTKGNFRYKITLHMYRDCKQNVAGTVQFDPKIKIGIYHSNTPKSKYKTVEFALVYKNLVPAPGRTDCPENQNFCIEEGFYESVIELEPSTLGYELTYEVCCRNIQNNIVTGSSQPTQGQTYYCKIPPTNINNSSPVFINGVPSPYMCINDTTSFLNTAVDRDGDSLVYSFVKPFGGSIAASIWEPPANLSLKSIQYNSGFDENKPFGSNGYSSIDPVNGLTQYFAKNTGNYVVAVEVTEYRNGAVLSTVRLDLQIIFINCGINRKPNISSNKGKIFDIEAGSKLCFDVIADDPDNDNLKLTADGDIFTGANGWKGPKATLSAKTGKGSITTEFCWQTSCDQAKNSPYLFAVTVYDDGCPGKYNAVNFSIKVNPFVSKLDIGGPTSLCQNAIGVYQTFFQAPFSKIEWEVTQGIILSGQNTNQLNVKWNVAGQGKVRVREISQFGCLGPWKELLVNVIPSPVTPIIAGDDTVCLNSTGHIYAITNFSGNITGNWIVRTGIVESGSNNVISVAWPKIGNQTILAFTVNSNGCFSDTGYFKVNVRKPIPSILGPNSICPNAKKIEYNAKGLGGSSYNWSISGGSFEVNSKFSKVVVNWGNEGIGTLTVVETDRFGCQSDPINYSVNKTYTMDAEFPKGPNSVCEFEKGVPYFVYPSSGTSYNWTITGGNLVPPGNTNLILVDWGKAGLGIVDITRQAYDSVNKRACVSLPAKFDVNINPTPNANTIEGDFELCQTDDSMFFTLNGFAGSTYLWRLDGNAINRSGQGTKTIKLGLNKPGNYNLSVIELSKDSCFGNLIDSVIIVHPKPIADSILGQAIICSPDLLNRNYTINGFNKSTFKWQINNGIILSGNGNDSILVSWSEIEPAWLKVLETSEYGCMGDTIIKTITIDKLNIEMLVVTVGTPDDNMDITWITPNSKSISRTYELYKRKSGDFLWQNLNNIGFTNYIEQPLNTDLNAFDYKVNVKDLCGVDKFTDVHTNVWLSGSKTEDPYAVNMDFTPYFGFKNGVSKYVLLRKIVDESNSFIRYDSFTAPQKLFYKNGLDGYEQCYRILSYENAGNGQVSYSNEICFNFSPTIYIPNAFTPNNDGLNDYFYIQAGAVKTFELKIYNRWGEELWRTNDYKSNGWDGIYKENLVQMDVYMYVVTLTDFRDKVYNMNGTVHVIR